MVSKKEMAIITNGEKQSAIITEKEINRFTLHNYFRAILPQKGTALTLGITFSLTAICFGAILPSLLAHAIDLVSQHRSLKWGDGLLPTLSYALLIVILATMSNAIGLHFFVRLDSPTQNRLRSQVLDRLLHESASFYADAMTGSLTGNVIAYTNSYATVQFPTSHKTHICSTEQYEKISPTKNRRQPIDKLYQQQRRRTFGSLSSNFPMGWTQK